MRKLCGIIVGALMVGSLTACPSSIGGHGGTSAPPGTGSGRTLSHTAVEKFIQANLSVNVVCNNGEDFPMHRAGETFLCEGEGKTFTVTIKNPDTGAYQVS